MKRALALVLLVLAIGVPAFAQQRPQPLPTDQGQGGEGVPLPRPTTQLPPLKYPAPAASYEMWVQYWLQLVRTLPGRYHVAQADVDSVVLMLKDCASRAEADGYVTRNEARSCRRQTMARLHELATPYMLQQMGGD